MENFKHQTLVTMKSPTTATIEGRKIAIEFDIINALQVVFISVLITILSVLLYKSFYGWSIGIAVLSLGAYKIYHWYKAFVNFDWSIDISDFTMDDVMEDRERDAFRM